MIRISSKIAKAMEFTRFRKKDNVSDDDLLYAVLNFEKTISSQNGLIFHCLVRNFDNEYANVLFGESMDSLKELGNSFGHLPAIKQFFEYIEMSSVKIEYHDIKKENFLVPNDFSCIEKGTFSIINKEDARKLNFISESIEKEYLNKFDNTKEHFIGEIEPNLFSEITFGKTMGQTKHICMGYFNNNSCMELLNILNKDTMNLDFWYVIA